MQPLTMATSLGGCAAKVGPDELSRILEGVTASTGVSQTLLGKHDAGHIKLGTDVHVVQSVDVITPISDDPGVYGAIAVEHALSDIFVMGAQPVSALFILGFPSFVVSTQTAKQIIKGAVDRLSTHGAVLLKGHTISTRELIFGAAVTGILLHQPEYIGCQDGDVLILTKPLGSGIVSTALKLFNAQAPLEAFSLEMVLASEQVMLESNSYAAKAMHAFDVHACTDITGFGFLGHLFELLTTQGWLAQIDFNAVPLIPGTLELAQQDVVSSAAERNASHWWDSVEFDEKLSYAERMILYDSQTSGGLLLSVPKHTAGRCLTVLRESGVQTCSVVGWITKREGDTKIQVHAG
ncbi:MAG: selenide, water dikinase SelD [Caldilineaceae bacterium]|nr:selenide, water dikinase SelD [Caldilineaceae bacterium]